MADLSWFNAKDVAPKKEFEAIPSGKYLAAIVESAQKQTKAGTGHYLELKFSIIDGLHKGRKLWTRLNIRNPNQEAVDIARSELSAIYQALGLEHVNDSSALHLMPLIITVKSEPKPDGKMGINIVEYASKDSTILDDSDGPPTWVR